MATMSASENGLLSESEAAVAFALSDMKVVPSGYVPGGTHMVDRGQRIATAPCLLPNLLAAPADQCPAGSSRLDASSDRWKAPPLGKPYISAFNLLLAAELRESSNGKLVGTTSAPQPLQRRTQGRHLVNGKAVVQLDVSPTGGPGGCDEPLKETGWKEFLPTQGAANGHSKGAAQHLEWDSELPEVGNDSSLVQLMPSRRHDSLDPEAPYSGGLKACSSDEQWWPRKRRRVGGNSRSTAVARCSGSSCSHSYGGGRSETDDGHGRRRPLKSPRLGERSSGAVSDPKSPKSKVFRPGPGDQGESVPTLKAVGDGDEVERTIGSYKGISRDATGKWEAYVYCLRKKIYLGSWDLEDDAARAHDRATINIFGRGSKTLNLHFSAYAHEAESLERMPRHEFITLLRGDARERRRRLGMPERRGRRTSGELGEGKRGAEVGSPPASGEEPKTVLGSIREQRTKDTTDHSKTDSQRRKAEARQLAAPTEAVRSRRADALRWSPNFPRPGHISVAGPKSTGKESADVEPSTPSPQLGCFKCRQRTRRTANWLQYDGLDGPDSPASASWPRRSAGTPSKKRDSTSANENLLTPSPTDAGQSSRVSDPTTPKKAKSEASAAVTVLFSPKSPPSMPGMPSPTGGFRSPRSRHNRLRAVKFTGSPPAPAANATLELPFIRSVSPTAVKFSSRPPASASGHGGKTGRKLGERSRTGTDPMDESSPVRGSPAVSRCSMSSWVPGSLQPLAPPTPKSTVEESWCSPHLGDACADGLCPPTKDRPGTSPPISKTCGDTPPANSQSLATARGVRPPLFSVAKEGSSRAPGPVLAEPPRQPSPVSRRVLEPSTGATSGHVPSPASHGGLPRTSSGAADVPLTNRHVDRASKGGGNLRCPSSNGGVLFKLPTSQGNAKASVADLADAPMGYESKHADILTPNERHQFVTVAAWTQPTTVEPKRCVMSPPVLRWQMATAPPAVVASPHHTSVTLPLQTGVTPRLGTGVLPFLRTPLPPMASPVSALPPVNICLARAGDSSKGGLTVQGAITGRDGLPGKNERLDRLVEAQILLALVKRLGMAKLQTASPSTGVYVPVNGKCNPAVGSRTPVKGIGSSINGISSSVTGINGPINGMSSSVKGINSSNNGKDGSINGIAASTTGIVTSIKRGDTSTDDIQKTLTGAGDLNRPKNPTADLGALLQATRWRWASKLAAEKWRTGLGFGAAGTDGRGSSRKWAVDENAKGAATRQWGPDLESTPLRNDAQDDGCVSFVSDFKPQQTAWQFGLPLSHRVRRLATSPKDGVHPSPYQSAAPTPEGAAPSSFSQTIGVHGDRRQTAGPEVYPPPLLEKQQQPAGNLPPCGKAESARRLLAAVQAASSRPSTVPDHSCSSNSASVGEGGIGREDAAAGNHRRKSGIGDVCHVDDEEASGQGYSKAAEGEGCQDERIRQEEVGESDMDDNSTVSFHRIHDGNGNKVDSAKSGAGKLRGLADVAWVESHAMPGCKRPAIGDASGGDPDAAAGDPATARGSPNTVGVCVHDDQATSRLKCRGACTKSSGPLGKRVMSSDEMTARNVAEKELLRYL